MLYRPTDWCVRRTVGRLVVGKDLYICDKGGIQNAE